MHMGKTWADTGRSDNGPRAVGVTTLSEGLQGANYGVTPEFTGPGRCLLSRNPTSPSRQPDATFQDDQPV